MKKSMYLGAALLICLVFIGVTLAQRPEVNIDPARHPNLAEAQQHIAQAYEKIEAAQQANQNQLGGHADRAKQLLEQASRELRAAARYANQRR